MTYDLYIGDRTFSSWSLRGWLMLKKFDLPFTTHMVGLYSGTMAEDLASFVPAKQVPVLRLPDGTYLGETVAIAETLAERHPEKGLWPNDPAARATARWLTAAMAAGFSDLRGHCPMQLLYVTKKVDVSAGVLKDLAQLEALWQRAQAVTTEEGPWLFGRYTLADAFYAPAVARIVGYDLPVSDTARAYCKTTVQDTAFKEWRAEGLKVPYDPMPYDIGPKQAAWPE